MKTLQHGTIAILKNFASINKNLMVREGNTVATIAEAENILAYATVEDSFTQDFGIYDLPEFLSIYDLLEDPVLDFDTCAVTMSSGRTKAKYQFADESILTFPKKKIKMPEPEITVNITADILTQIRKAASALSHTIVSIKSENNSVVLSVIDPKNTTANTYSITLLENASKTQVFDFQFFIANIKIIPGNYTVDISKQFISHWVNDSINVEYYIALEKTSTFED